MKAIDLKAEMLTHMLYRLHYDAAITEYGGKGCTGNADIFGIMSSGFTHEYEVKVDKADLAGELKSIDVLCNPLWRSGEKNWLEEKGLSKFDKHARYLHIVPPGEMPWGHNPWGVGDEEWAMVPNRFSFVVTAELQEFALAGLQETPYGLFVVSTHENGGHPWSDVVCKRVAKKIHGLKAAPEIAANIMRKACTEVEVLRRNQASGLRCTACRGELPTRCDKCSERMQKDRAYRRASDKCWKAVDDLPFGAERSEKFRACMLEAGF